LKSPPLALDLHYLLTAYGSSDWQAEALLGYAVMLLHQNPVLARSDITTALNALPTNNASNPLSSELGSSGLAEQFETIKITPSTLGREELAWLWTALKADYRPSFPFQVSVVLMQPSTPLAFSLPVLSRAITVQAGAPAQLLQVSPPDHEAAAAPGMLVTVSGSGLAGATGVVLANPRLRIDYPSFTPASTSDTQVTFVVPNAPAALPAGVYNVTLQFAGSRAGLTQSSNTLLLPIAPTILATPAPKATAITGGTQVTLDCAPSVLPNQTVQLIMGGTAVPAQPIPSTASQLSFQFTPPLAAGNYLARLQVDGVMSPVAVNWTAQPPSFTGPMVTV
jgi:Pvc16 N-terminal domain